MSSNPIPNPKPMSPGDKLRAAGGNDGGPEELMWSGTYSGKAMVGTWIILGLATVALIVAYVLIPTLQQPIVRWVLLGAIALGWIVPLVMLFYRKLAYSWELSNHRLKHRYGILLRRHDRVEVIDIDDVTFRQGIIEALFNVGTIRVRSSDASHPELQMRGISDVKHVSDLIDKLRRDERTKRGLYVESV